MRPVLLQTFKSWRLSEHNQYRLLEILPGFLVWSTFFLAILLSFVIPVYVIYFIILFDLYWFVRAIYTLVYLLIAFRRYRRSIKVDWLEVAQKLPKFDSIWHLVVIPIAGEPYEVLRQAFDALHKVNFPRQRVMVVLACEERWREITEPYAKKIQENFSQAFGQLLVSWHPANLVGEVAGKGANIAWAGRQAKVMIDQRRLAYENIVVTTLDVDSIVHPQYFSYLTTTFLNHPNRLRTSYQPLPFFYNNIWESPAITRIVATSTTFWLMTETIRPDRLFTFSSHSMPFTALVDVGFWQNDIVTEDSRIFLQCFMEYDGDYSVTPMYIPISMDTVSTTSLWRTLVNQYKQQRRWAYGVENFPYMVWNFLYNKRISFAKKIKYIWNQLEGVYSWATAPILIFILGWLPIHVALQQENFLLVVVAAPDLLRWLMILAMVGMVAAAVLSTVMLPKTDRNPWRLVPMVLQWVLLPITMIAFGSIPATDAQTRLMLGKYLGFWVTEKSRLGSKTNKTVSSP